MGTLPILIPPQRTTSRNMFRRNKIPAASAPLPIPFNTKSIRPLGNMGTRLRHFAIFPISHCPFSTVSPVKNDFAVPRFSLTDIPIFLNVVLRELEIVI